MSALTMIAAIARGNVIGYKGEMPWGHLPRDLKHFKDLTMGHSVVVGYKTLLSIANTLGRKENLLPGRKIYVLTHKPSRVEQFPGCIAVSDIDSVVKLGLKEKVFIAGGEDVYHQFITLPQTLTVHLTQIHADFEGDTFFPQLPAHEWLRAEASELYPADAKNKYAMNFYTMVRGSSL